MKSYLEYYLDSHIIEYFWLVRVFTVVLALEYVGSRTHRAFGCEHRLFGR